MNWFVFSNWCESKAFPAMKRTMQKSVLVLDRATYHTFLDEEDKRPTTFWNKSKLANDIARWYGIPEDWPLKWRLQKSKNELLEQAREIYPSPTYKIQKIADKFSEGDFEIKILLLPVAHLELNPVEMFRSKMKRVIATKNMTFPLSAVEEMTRTAIQKFNSNEFSKYVEHMKLEEMKYREGNE